MTEKQRRNAYRSAVEAWLDDELQFLVMGTMSGGIWKDWKHSHCPEFTKPPEHYRRRPKSSDYWGVLDTDDNIVAVCDSIKGAATTATQLGLKQAIHLRAIKKVIFPPSLT